MSLRYCKWYSKMLVLMYYVKWPLLATILNFSQIHHLFTYLTLSKMGKAISTLHKNQHTVLDIYNRPRDFWCTFFLGFLQFSQQLIKIQKLTIYHLKGLIVDIYILEGQGPSTIRNKPNSLNVKKQTFQENWVWQVLEAVTPLSF